MNATVSLDSVWNLVQSLSSDNRKWLADKICENISRKANETILGEKGIRTTVIQDDTGTSERFLRRSRQADCPDIYALVCDMEAKQLPHDEFKEIYSEQLEDNRHTCLVCEENGKLTGCINLRMERQLHHAGRICEIMELVVHPDYRCQGIGRYLFEAACNEAKSQGCLQIEVCCNQLRLQTHRFYETCGMHNFHYKFSLSFTQTGDYSNELGR
ncbi:GNAT family N-acetyltransferase [Phocaeicola salanitronis]|uniref:GNAT family N-acetyltransferase n=1 Tax=Phocaeicola salanitronis TaxID=376805 RepID=UPI0023F9E03B|nr:GNAT family N-acetyltransferase [Phocaeicola salanitronis]